MRGEKDKRLAIVSGCDGLVASPVASASVPAAGATAPVAPVRLWVRYESGIEEQVELARITPEHDVQAHAKGLAK